MDMTFVELKRALGVSEKELLSMMSQCGISTGRMFSSLSQSEIDRLYDLWAHLDADDDSQEDNSIFSGNEICDSVRKDEDFDRVIDSYMGNAYGRSIVPQNIPHKRSVSHTYEQTKTRRSPKTEVGAKAYPRKNTLDTSLSERPKRIFIDTCSLLSQGGALFLKNFEQAFQNTRQTLIVPWSVCKELEKLSQKKGDQKLSVTAQRMLMLLSDYKTKGIIEIFGSPDDGDFADNMFLQLAIRFSLKYMLIIITQDRLLQKELLDFKDSKAVKGRSIKVRRLRKNGTLSVV